MFLPVLVFFIFLLSSCASSGQDASIEFFAMDTIITAKIPDTSNDHALKKLEEEIKNLEYRFSKTIDTSDISILNTQHSMPIADLSPDTTTLLQTAYSISAKTGGCFDFALGTLSDVWGFGHAQQKAPPQAELEQALIHSGYKHVQLLSEEIVLQAGVQLDLGGIAKGYATDQAVSLLQEDGVQNALLSLGGNVYVMGKNHGRLWNVGIADPAHPNELIGFLSLTDKAVVTSGDYQRYFEQDGVRYHHIMDSMTGYPAQSDLASVTVIHSSATLADGYSTALFVMGLKRAQLFVETYNQMEAIFITKSGEIYCSAGAQKLFTQIS